MNPLFSVTSLSDLCVLCVKAFLFSSLPNFYFPFSIFQ
jgi:hypothetical protein